MNAKRSCVCFVVLMSMLAFQGKWYSATPVAAAHSPTSSSQEKADIAQIWITTQEAVQKDDYVSAEITILASKSEAFATIFDPAAKIKIRGNSTAYLSKLPFNIKFDSAQSVLGMPAGKKWSLLANYIDTSLMRNKLAYDFAEEIGLAYSCKSAYAEVWLNGEYNGNYLVVVPVEAGKDRVDIDPDDNEFLLEINVGRVEEDVTYINTSIHRFEINEPENPSEEQMKWLSEFLSKAENAIKNSDYEQIKKYVDIESFVDFYIIQDLFKNMDANSSSTRFYIKNDILYAGPLWDLDLSSGNVSTHEAYKNYLTYNNWGEYGNQSGNSFEGFWLLQPETEESIETIRASWIGNLMKGQAFQSLIYTRYRELQDEIVNLYSDNSLGESRIDTLLKTYGNSFSRDNQRWPVQKSRGSELYRKNETTYAESVSFLSNFLKERNTWLLENMLPENFPILPPVENRCAQANPASAAVLVNGKSIAFDAYNVGGNNYFKLRDLAMSVSSSNKKFQVEWNESIKAINLISNTTYTPVGGEFSKGRGRQTQCTLNSSAIFKDGDKVSLSAYNINGNNYFKLRDVAEMFDIGIVWDAAAKTIEINTEISYEE
ncbi:MAG: hypothetical protein EOM59_01675 [Clostridia bacterium]|nr:hypothetical protein [Clostridia bacterium]